MSSCRRGEGNLEGIYDSAGNGPVRVRPATGAPRFHVSPASSSQTTGANGRAGALRARLIEATAEVLAESSVPRLGWTGVTQLLA
jgi:hypothetical protein